MAYASNIITNMRIIDIGRYGKLPFSIVFPNKPTLSFVAS